MRICADDLGRLTRRMPRLLDLDTVAAETAGKNKLSIVVSLAAKLREQRPCRRAERHPMKRGCLGSRARLAPDALLQIKVGPAHAEDFAAPCPGQQQQADDAGALLVGALGQSLAEAF